LVFANAVNKDISANDEINTPIRGNSQSGLRMQISNFICKFSEISWWW